ncbi:hypothetical protein TOI97_08040 [Denitrificimonas sp. JX-1]|uniref:Transposase n=1 Tax=Denitrificimonas halotolerans TaxID=3098930 RepID=A0ABU5GRU7_9GAMM|nr:hypothetical protein [Denitrificimonas sp. JX-1]MDY7219514.1 hypothetical protein [Denitrificimonas sp. JX-1]
MARSVNFSWNFVNGLSQCSIKELGLHSQTLQRTPGEYVTHRKQFKKARLNWRKSGGACRFEL